MGKRQNRNDSRALKRRHIESNSALFLPSITCDFERMTSMKRGVVHFLSCGFWLVVTLANGQTPPTSVLVAQKPDTAKTNHDEPRSTRTCRQWPMYYDGDFALYYCNFWDPFNNCDAYGEPAFVYEPYT